MYYRILGSQDLIGSNVLIRTVLMGMDRKERAQWDPIVSEERHFFDRTWTMLNGCFMNNGTMVGMSGLFMNPVECTENALLLDLEPETTAELSRCAVLSPFRGRNIMLRLNTDLIDYAKLRAKTDLVAAIHPDNLGMATSLVKLGMKPEMTVRDPKMPPKVIYRMKI